MSVQIPLLIGFVFFPYSISSEADKIHSARNGRICADLPDFSISNILSYRCCAMRFLTFRIRTAAAAAVFAGALALASWGAYAADAASVYWSGERSLPVYSVEREDNKIAITFDCAWGDEYTGQLLAALEVMRDFGLNMVKIESRPCRNGMGRYVFFADFTFGDGKEELMRILAALGAKTSSLKFLGKYETEAL